MQHKDFGDVGKQVLEDFRDWVVNGMGGEEWTLEPENHEGWRVSVDEGEGKQGWLLLRSSLHDPLLVLNVESELVGGQARICCVDSSGLSCSNLYSNACCQNFGSDDVSMLAAATLNQKQALTSNIGDLTVAEHGQQGAVRPM